MPREKRPTSPQPRGGLLDRDGLIGSEELAEWLDVPIGTLEQWASRGGGPVYHKVGIHRKYHPVDVKSWLAERRRATTSEPAA
jgi:phage terminase Nu1 subunit (DNA packaging protein)